MQIDTTQPDTNTTADDEFEIEVVDDAAVPVKPEGETTAAPPEKAEVETPAKPTKPAQDDDDEDLAEYGEKVRKRISKEVWKRREAERKAAALEEQLSRVNTEKQQFQQRQYQSEEAIVQANEAALKAERERIEKEYKSAYDTGDTDAMFRATDALANVRVREIAIENWKRQRPAQPQQTQQTQQQRPQQQTQQPQQADPRALEWASNNHWFGRDAAKTGAAYAIDAQLKSEGFDPRSDDYYEELDKRMADSFPDLRKQVSTPEPAQTQRPQTSQPVVGATRTSGTGGKKKVTLTASQVEMANKLGVPLAEYARYLNQGN